MEQEKKKSWEESNNNLKNETFAIDRVIINQKATVNKKTNRTSLFLFGFSLILNWLKH